MNPFIIFRVSVIVAPLIAIITLFYSVFAVLGFSQEWQDILTWSGDEGLLSEGGEFKLPENIIWIFLTGFLMVAMGNQIALFFYWKPSRLIYFVVTILSFIIIPFCGLTVSPPLETLGFELSNYISAITLTLAYFSPVAARFE